MSAALGHAAQLAQAELALMSEELKVSVRSLAIAGGLLGGALLVAGAALNFLGAAAVAGLVQGGMDLWLAALIVGVVFLVLCVIAVLWAVAKVKVAGKAPRRSFRSIGQDFRTAMEAATHDI
jgi:hypothetical protein